MRSALNKIFGDTQSITGIAILSVVIVVIFPPVLDIFRLNLVGKYLSYAFVAVGLVMLWGYGGILSLGQGVFLAWAAISWRCS